MKRLMSVALVCAAVVAGAIGSVARSGDSAAKGECAASKAWAKAERTPAHERLDALVGKWDAEVRYWVGEGTEPIVSKGAVTREWTVNRLFLKEDATHGSPSGETFGGISYYGFDPLSGEYQSTWMCELGAAMAHGAGAWDEATRTITLRGVEQNPIAGRAMPFRCEIRIDGPRRHTLTMVYDLGNGAEHKAVEVVYTRRGG